MMVWKRDFLLNMAIFGIYVKFLGIAASHDRFSPKGEILYIYIFGQIYFLIRPQSSPILDTFLCFLEAFHHKLLGILRCRTEQILPNDKQHL